MKKITVILAALAAAFAVSCTKEAPETQIPQDQNVPAGMKMVTITASIEGADTKTSYDAAGKFSWTKGDKIAIKGSDNQFYTFTTTENAASATFTGYMPEGVSLQKHALYPAESAVKDASAGYFYTIPEYKDLTGGFSADIPMSSYVSAGTYNFVHMTGAALLTFTNIYEAVDVVDISIKAATVRLSGTQQTWSGTPFTFSGDYAANDSEKTFTRRVSVSEDNTAQVYLPYKGEFWDNCTIDIVGYDADGNEYVLLRDKKMKGSSANVFEPAHVVPYAPLTLPDYRPAVDWSKVEWDGENVATAVVDPSAQYSKVKELKVSSDDYYMYVRLNMSMEDPFLGDYIDIFLSDGNGSTSAWWGWATKGTNVYAPGLGSHKGSIDVTSGQLTKMKFILPGEVETTVDVHTEVAGEDIYWYMAYPCDYIEPYVNQDGKVYVSFMLWKSWDPYGVIPTVNSNMLEVTLP